MIDIRRTPILVAGKASANFIQETTIDFEDDFQMPRQQAAEQIQRPFLQGLGQQRMAGVGKRLARDIPGLLPTQLMIVDQQPHQFGNRHDGMRIIQLNDNLVRELFPIVVEQSEATNDILQRAGHEEILLLQTQLFCLPMSHRWDRGPC